MEKITKPIVMILYHVLFIVLGVALALSDTSSYFLTVTFTSFACVGIVGLISYLNIELMEPGGFFYVFFGIARRIITIAVVGFHALAFFSCYSYSETLNIFGFESLGDACVYAIPFLGLIYVLLRPIVYSFTLDRLSDESVSLVTLLLPFISYAVSVVMILLSALWSFIVFSVLWFLMLIFIRGSLNSIERFILTALFYLSCFVAGMMMLETPNYVAVFTLIAMSACFWYYIGIDLCRETTVPYWIFTVLGGLMVIVFTILTVTFAPKSELVGMQEGIKFGFVDALKNAIYFTPLVYALVRPVLFKLGAENDWENGIDEVFTAVVLIVVSYVLAVIMLLIGFAYVIGVLAAVLLLPMLYMAFTDAYVPLSDYVSELRSSGEDYIHTITIIE